MSLVALPLGEGALRIVLPEGADPAPVLAALRSLARVIDVVVTERHACVYFDPAAPPEDPAACVARALTGSLPPPPTRAHTIRAVYDGEDLARVASLAGLDVDATIALHAGTEYVVRFVGFLPGFAYLGEVPERLQVPRLPSPRTRVPRGAVGLAGPRTGVYPFASPGGWNLIARAIDVTLFDPRLGALLRTGDRVRFEPA